MKQKTAKETRLQKLQNESNAIRERMGYMTNPVNIAAANRTIDRIDAQMAKLLGK